MGRNAGFVVAEPFVPPVLVAAFEHARQQWTNPLTHTLDPVARTVGQMKGAADFYTECKIDMAWLMPLPRALPAFLGEVFRLARTGGPQLITRQGKAGVVMLPVEHFAQLVARSRQPKSLVQFFRDSPLVGLDLDFERGKDRSRYRNMSGFDSRAGRECDGTESRGEEALAVEVEMSADLAVR